MHSKHLKEFLQTLESRFKMRFCNLRQRELVERASFSVLPVSGMGSNGLGEDIFELDMNVVVEPVGVSVDHVNWNHFECLMIRSSTHVDVAVTISTTRYKLFYFFFEKLN